MKSIPILEKGSYDSGGSWKYSLVQELKTAGYDVDANKLIG
jgi:hypothetical protein